MLLLVKRFFPYKYNQKKRTATKRGKDVSYVRKMNEK